MPKTYKYIYNRVTEQSLVERKIKNIGEKYPDDRVIVGMVIAWTYHLCSMALLSIWNIIKENL